MKVDICCKTFVRTIMDCFSGSISGELLDITSRYFTACNLSSYVLPLPFCDESLLDRHAVLSKVLANSSCISKDQLFGIIQGFSNGGARVSSDYDNFSHSYDLILPGKRWNRQLRKAPSTTTGIRTTLRQSKTVLTEKLTAELSSMHETDQIIDKLDSSLRSLWEPHTMGFVMIIAARIHNRNVADDGRFIWLVYVNVYFYIYNLLIVDVFNKQFMISHSFIDKYNNIQVYRVN